jgi:hypothetical protein
VNICQSWESYRRGVLSPKAPPIQVSECQIAFYGGASSVLAEVFRLGDLDVPEDEGVQKLQGLLDEVTAFKDLLGACAKGSG